MKKSEWMFAFLITLAVCLTAYSAKIIKDRVNLPSQPQIDYRALQGQLDRIENSMVKIAADYTEKLDETTRQNVRLLQEVADQARQIKEFGWLKKAMDKEGLR